MHTNIYTSLISESASSKIVYIISFIEGAAASAAASTVSCTI